MKTDELSDYEIAVLSKLMSRRIIHKHHIRLPTLLKCGWKPHEKRLVKEAVYSLIKKGYICWVKRDKKALSINKEKTSEIKDSCAKEC